MGRFQASSILTTVEKMMISGAIVFSAVMAEAADTTGTSGSTTTTSNNNKPTVLTKADLGCTDSQQVGIVQGVATCVDKVDRNENLCRTSKDSADSAKRDMIEKCSKAGYSFSECLQISEKCKETDKGGDDQLMQQMYGMFGSQYGSSMNLMSNTNGSCPNLSSKDYFTEKDKLQKDLQNVADQNEKLEKEMTDEKGKVDKEMKDAQEKLAESQKKVKEQSKKISEEKRTATENSQKQQAEAAQAVRESNVKMIAKRAEMATAEHDYAKQMIDLKESSAELACLAEVKQLRDKLAEAGIFKSGRGSSGGSYLTVKERERKSLQDQFDNCISKTQGMRLKLIDSHQNQMRGMQEELKNMQEASDEASQSVTTSTNNLTEQINSLTQEEKDANNALLQEMQASQSNLQNLNTTYQQRVQSLKTRQSELTNRKMQINNDITKLGPEPARGNEVGWRSADGAVDHYLSTVYNFRSDCCPKKSSERKGNLFADTEYCKLKGTTLDEMKKRIDRSGDN